MILLTDDAAARPPSGRDRLILWTRSQLSRRDVVAVAVMATVLLAAMLIATERRALRFDEFTSWLIFTTPSFGAFWSSVADLIGSPPTYWLTGRVWTSLFGGSELSLRLFTMAGFIAAIGTIWLILRSSFGFWATFVGVAGTWLLSDALLDQLGEIRTYGLFIFLTALNFALAIGLATTRRPRLGHLLLNVGLQAVLVLTHVYGVLYGGMLLGTILAHDLLQRRIRPAVYASYVIGWMAYLLWIPAHIRQADSIIPHSWMDKPSLNDLSNMLGGTITSLGLLSLILATFWLLFGLARPATAGSETATLPQPGERRHALLLAAIGLAAVPIPAWVISNLTEPTFMSRYLLPSLLGWSVLVTAVVSAMGIESVMRKPSSDAAPSSRRWARVAQIAVGGVLVVSAITPLFGALRVPLRDFGLADLTTGCGHLPMVVENGQGFLQRFHYRMDGNRFFFALDWEAATAPGALKNETVDYKVLDNLVEHYPRHNVVRGEDFLAQNTEFLVLDEPGRLWSEMRVERSGDYRIAYLGRMGKAELLHVTRADAATTLSSCRPMSNASVTDPSTMVRRHPAL